MSSDISHRIPLTGEDRSIGVVPLPIYWYHSKGNWMLYNFAADSFYIMKLCSRLFVLHCRSRPKYDTSMQFDPHFEEVRSGVEPWWMARWQDLAEFLLSVIELLFLSLIATIIIGLRKFIMRTCSQALCMNRRALTSCGVIWRLLSTIRTYDSVSIRWLCYDTFWSTVHDKSDADWHSSYSLHTTNYIAIANYPISA